MSNSRSVRDALHIARQHYEGGGWVPDWLSGLFSSEPKTPPDPKTVTYPDASESMRHMPTDKDMEDARKYGQYYGTPLDSFINPGQAVSRVINDPLLSANVANHALYNKVPSGLVDQEMADSYLKGALATGNSAISALGYDPRNAVSTRPSKSLALTVRGRYDPSQDAIWWNGEQPSTVAHESFHRGIEKLAQMEAKSPSGLLKENDINMLNKTAAESAARALMEKYLGTDVEMKNAKKGDIGERQILMSRYFAQNHAGALDRAEKAAAYHYAKKTPRGPRASGGSVGNAIRLARHMYATDGFVPPQKLTSRTIAENWTPPEDIDPRLGKFMAEYPAKMAESIAGIPQAIWDTVKYPGQLLYGEKQFDTDEAIKKAVDTTGAAMTGSFPFARAAAGEAVLGSGPILKTNNPRIDMSFKDVTKRVDELKEAAPKVASGEMSSAQYQELVNKYKPVSEWESVPKPASYEEMSNALRADQVANIGKGGAIPEGHPVGLRLDIPAYRDHGVWVPTIHDKIKSGSQPVMSHEPTALISNAVFSVPENKAMNVAKGAHKSPFATIDGRWVPFSEESANALAQQALKDKNWRQVGMDPERHSHFYDRATQEPILGAEQVLQVGPLVLAKNPTYGSKKDFKYESGGSVVDRALVLTSKKAASRRGRPE